MCDTCLDIQSLRAFRIAYLYSWLVVSLFGRLFFYAGRDADAQKTAVDVSIQLRAALYLADTYESGQAKERTGHHNAR